MANPLKFLVDESSGIKLAQFLQRAGFDVISVIKTMPGAQDEEILAWAFRDSRILVTNDKDFGSLIERRKFSHAGVILLRLRDDTPSARILALQSLITKFGEGLKDKFIVATEHRARIKGKSVEEF